MSTEKLTSVPQHIPVGSWKTSNKVPNYDSMTHHHLWKPNATPSVIENYSISRTPNMTKPRPINAFQKYGGRYANTITDSSMNRMEIMRAKKNIATRSGVRNVTAEGGTFMADGKIGQFSMLHEPFTLAKSHLTPSACSNNHSREQSDLYPLERQFTNFTKVSAAHSFNQNDNMLSPTKLARGNTTVPGIISETCHIQPMKSYGSFRRRQIGNSMTAFSTIPPRDKSKPVVKFTGPPVEGGVGKKLKEGGVGKKLIESKRGK
jgi:hypothetical protein